MISTVMTEREDPGPSRSVNATTRTDEPNVKIITMPWWQMAGIRSARVYLQTLVGLITAQGTGLADAMGVNISAGDFTHKLIVLMSISVAPAVVSLLQNLLEIFTKLDISNPQMRA